MNKFCVLVINIAFTCGVWAAGDFQQDVRSIPRVSVREVDEWKPKDASDAFHKIYDTLTAKAPSDLPSAQDDFIRGYFSSCFQWLHEKKGTLPEKVDNAQFQKILDPLGPTPLEPERRPPLTVLTLSSVLSALSFEVDEKKGNSDLQNSFARLVTGRGAFEVAKSSSIEDRNKLMGTIYQHYYTRPDYGRTSSSSSSMSYSDTLNKLFPEIMGECKNKKQALYTFTIAALAVWRNTDAWNQSEGKTAGEQMISWLKKNPNLNEKEFSQALISVCKSLDDIAQSASRYFGANEKDFRAELREINQKHEFFVDRVAQAFVKNSDQQIFSDFLNKKVDLVTNRALSQVGNPASARQPLLKALIALSSRDRILDKDTWVKYVQNNYQQFSIAAEEIWNTVEMNSVYCPYFSDLSKLVSNLYKIKSVPIKRSEQRDAEVLSYLKQEQRREEAAERGRAEQEERRRKDEAASLVGDLSHNPLLDFERWQNLQTDVPYGVEYNFNIKYKDSRQIIARMWGKQEKLRLFIEHLESNGAPTEVIKLATIVIGSKERVAVSSDIYRKKLSKFLHPDKYLSDDEWKYFKEVVFINIVNPR
ncbi:MAG: hypothetical protein NTX76_01030 [Alphaproteobacteria bacterium]|nr:hypothetical protein [Alphaproteobacteria bacterium]